MTADRAALDVDRVQALLLSPAGPARRVEVRDRVGSTSTELVAAVRREPEAWPEWSVLVADHQDAGRGRSGRGWHTPARAALTFSVLLRPAVPPVVLGWLPLLAGAAVVRALGEVADLPAVLKWPNDVLVPGPGGEVPGWGRHRKVAGVLAEAVPGVPSAVVVGLGVNVAQTPEELPVPSATSLAAVGAPVDRTELLAAVLRLLATRYTRWVGDGGRDAALADEVREACTTLGRHVRIDRPGGAQLTGRAVDLDAGGALVVRDESGQRHTVLAGDVHHLRLAP